MKHDFVDANLVKVKTLQKATVFVLTITLAICVWNKTILTGAAEGP